MSDKEAPDKTVTAPDAEKLALETVRVFQILKVEDGLDHDNDKHLWSLAYSIAYAVFDRMNR